MSHIINLITRFIFISSLKISHIYKTTYFESIVKIVYSLLLCYLGNKQRCRMRMQSSSEFFYHICNLHILNSRHYSISIYLYYVKQIPL